MSNGRTKECRIANTVAKPQAALLRPPISDLRFPTSDFPLPLHHPAVVFYNGMLPPIVFYNGVGRYTWSDPLGV